MVLPEGLQEASIIASCATPSPDKIVSHYGKRVIIISDHAVVKWGLDVTKDEADNQRLAFEILDSHIVRVPKVYSFFSDERGLGYIVMEFIDGKVVDPLEDISTIEKVTRILDYFATLRHTIPGPLSGGFCRGLLFPDTQDVAFSDLDDMEKWFNSRLLPHNPKLSFQECELVFCHLDIAPRNIIWQEDGPPCLIDWSSAGYYPRLFEFCMQWILEGKDGRFNTTILEMMEPLPEHELAQKEPMLIAWRNIQKYPFQSNSSKSRRRLERDAASRFPVPAPPMPAYPPDWVEQFQREQLAQGGSTAPDSPSFGLVSQRNFPWIPVWDDHEIANNAHRDGFSSLNNTEESFLNDSPQISSEQRKMNAVRAYFEWMPLRQVDMDDGLRIWRNFQMGNLFDLIMLDTRHHDRSITDLGWNSDYIKMIHDDAGRTLMGARQENWYHRQLSESQDRGAKWRIIGSQLRFARIEYEEDGELTYSGDSWDAYRANQNRTFQHFYDNNIKDTIMLAGDTHVNWVSDIAWVREKEYDGVTGEGAIGVESAVTSLSSPGTEDPIAVAEKEALIYSNNEELQWHETYYRGYFELHVRPDDAEAKFFGVPSVATRNAWELPLANFTVKRGDNHLTRPIAGGVVEAGVIQHGETKHTTMTMNTETGLWEEIGFEKMYIRGF